jgi:hypothetical protein
MKMRLFVRCCCCINVSVSGCSVHGAWESMAGPVIRTRGQGAGANAHVAPTATQNGVPAPEQPQPAAIQMV